MTIPLDWRRSNEVRTYDLYWCSVSSYGKVYPSPSLDEISSFYDIPYYTHDSKQRQGEEVETNKRPLTFMTKLRQHLAWRFDRSKLKDESWWQNLLGLSPLSICELGCGSGDNLALLKSLGHRVVGVEPDLRAREVVKLQDITVHSGTAELLPDALREQLFDVVLLNHVLEHCIDPLEALRNAKSLLKTNGVLVLETPNNECIGSYSNGIAWPFLDVPRHLHFFTSTSLRKIAERAGFEWHCTEYEGYYVQFENSWLATETEIWKQFGVADRPFEVAVSTAWKLLIRTALAKASSKYASVRVIMRSSTIATS
jgi:2-polyprenyl-3-methyl-5-hydroxy-6-metoxy-1,4-benzoquinol methylase